MKLEGVIASATKRLWSPFASSTFAYELRPWLIGGLILALPLMLLLLGPTPWRVILGSKEKSATPVEGDFTEHFVGEFHESNRAFPDASLQIDMKLFAEVHHSQNEAYRQLVDGQENRYREAVSSVLRGLPPRDLREPTLTTLKRKVKVAMVSIAGTDTSLFDELIIPEFEAFKIN
ncbi:hypothetical protein K2X85_02125 [bacterium]|nr:hypothetical protein [bacterium]